MNPREFLSFETASVFNEAAIDITNAMEGRTYPNDKEAVSEAIELLKEAILSSDHSIEFVICGTAHRIENYAENANITVHHLNGIALKYVRMLMAYNDKDRLNARNDKTCVEIINFLIILSKRILAANHAVGGMRR